MPVVKRFREDEYPVEKKPEKTRLTALAWTVHRSMARSSRKSQTTKWLNTLLTKIVVTASFGSIKQLFEQSELKN